MLHEEQKAIAQSLLSGIPADAEDLIVAGEISAAARLRIYRNHFLISLTSALGQTFPVFQRLVGEGYFKGLAKDFILAHPPEAPCLFEYGGVFSDFCQTRTELAQYPYLPDMARFEWAINQAYHAPEVASKSLQTLALYPPDQLSAMLFKLHPSLSLLSSDYPLAAIWRTNNRPAGEEDEIDLSQGGVRLMIWRQGDDTVWRELTAAEFTFMQALVEGVSLGKAVERASGLDLSATLAMVLGAGVVSGFDHDAASDM